MINILFYITKSYKFISFFIIRQSYKINMYEKINSRIKPIMHSNSMKEIDINNIITEILYINHKGEGQIFYNKNNNLKLFDIDEFIHEFDEEINIYKIK